MKKPVLSARILYDLFYVSLGVHHLSRTLERELGISFVQWYLLRHLVDLPAVSAQRLAGAVGLHPSTLTQSIKRLRKKNYLVIEGDPRDSRGKIIAITRHGRNALQAADRQLEIHFSGLGQIAPALTKLRAYLLTQKTKVMHSNGAKARRAAVPERSGKSTRAGGIGQRV